MDRRDRIRVYKPMKNKECRHRWESRGIDSDVCTECGEENYFAYLGLDDTLIYDSDDYIYKSETYG